MKIDPMLAEGGTKKYLDLERFIFEPKMDGTRAICYKNGDLKFINRRNRNITHRYPEFDFKDNIKADSCILDGEIIVYDTQGNPSFKLLQMRDHTEKDTTARIKSQLYPATYVVFDILMKNGKVLTELALMERKKILEDTIADSKSIQKIFYTKNGKKLWEIVNQRGLEGIVAKDPDGKYFPGKRTNAWYKIKNVKSIDCIIVGYTQEIRIISALAVAVYYMGKLTFIGTVGTGFTENFLRELLPELESLKITNPPIEYKGSKEIIWVKPKIVCEVEYLNLSKDHIMRAPVFLRIREDKSPEECVL